MHTCEGCGATFDTEAELEAHLAVRPIYAMTGSHMSIDQWERYLMGCDMEEWQPAEPPAPRKTAEELEAEQARHLRELDGCPF